MASKTRRLGAGEAAAERKAKEALINVAVDQGPYPSKTSGFAASGAAARTGIEPDQCPRRRLAFDRRSAIRAELYQTLARDTAQTVHRHPNAPKEIRLTIRRNESFLDRNMKTTLSIPAAPSTLPLTIFTSI